MNWFLLFSLHSQILSIFKSSNFLLKLWQSFESPVRFALSISNAIFSSIFPQLIPQLLPQLLTLKFMFSKKATKIDKIFTVDLTLCSKCQIDSEDFVNFCGLLRKHKLYPTWNSNFGRTLTYWQRVSLLHSYSSWVRRVL